jgi:hypothetical protein
MKIIGYIFSFLFNPFGTVFSIDIKGVTVTKYKWLEIALLILLSILIAASLVYISHKFFER